MIHLLQTLLIAVTSSHQSADNFAIPATSCDTNPFTFTEISESLVLSHLDSLDPRKSTCPDGLSARFLKEIGYSISYLILLTFIAEWNCFFTDKKCSHILQFIKVHGALDNPGNFRPCNLCCVCSCCLFVFVYLFNN